MSRLTRMVNGATAEHSGGGEPEPVDRSTWPGLIAGSAVIAVVAILVVIVTVFDPIPEKQVDVVLSEEVACDLSGELVTYDLSEFAVEDARFEGFESFNVDLDLYGSGRLLDTRRLKVEPGGFAGQTIEASFSQGQSPTCRLTIFGISS